MFFFSFAEYIQARLKHLGENKVGGIGAEKSENVFRLKNLATQNYYS